MAALEAQSMFYICNNWCDIYHMLPFLLSKLKWLMYFKFYVFHHYFLKNSVSKFNDSNSIWSPSWNLVVFMSFIFKSFKICLHDDRTSCLHADRTSCLHPGRPSCLPADRTSCLNTERTSCLQADRTSCLYTDRTSCLYADRTSRLYSDRPSCLHADRTSYLYSDRTSCLYVDRIPWLHADRTSCLYSDLLHSCCSYCLFLLTFLSPATQPLYLTDPL